MLHSFHNTLPFPSPKCSACGILTIQCSSETHWVSLSPTIYILSINSNVRESSETKSNFGLGLTRAHIATDDGATDLVAVQRPRSDNDSYLQSSRLDSSNFGMGSLVMDIHLICNF